MVDWGTRCRERNDVFPGIENKRAAPKRSHQRWEMGTKTPDERETLKDCYPKKRWTEYMPQGLGKMRDVCFLSGFE